MILFFPLFPVFPQLFQKLTVPGRMKGGEGAHQAALKDILTGVQSIQPLPGLGLGVLQPLGEFVAELAQGLQAVLNGYVFGKNSMAFRKGMIAVWGL